MVHTYKRTIILWPFLQPRPSPSHTAPQISVDPERKMSSGTLDHLESQVLSRSISGVSVGPVRTLRESAKTQGICKPLRIQEGDFVAAAPQLSPATRTPYPRFPANLNSSFFLSPAHFGEAASLEGGEAPGSIDISGIDCPALRRLRQNPEGFSVDCRAVVSATFLIPHLCRRPQPDPRRHHGALDYERGQFWG